MEKYGVNELRKMFLEFFESKGHLAMKSFSLIPHNDKMSFTDQLRYGSAETLLHRRRDSAEKKSNNMPEMYPYRRY